MCPHQLNQFEECAFENLEIKKKQKKLLLQIFWQNYYEKRNKIKLLKSDEIVKTDSLPK